MTKMFVLLMLVPGGGGMSAEFSSGKACEARDACEAAIEAFAAETGKANAPIAVCVEQ